MKAGLLKDKIIILEPSTVTSEFGENSIDWIIKYTTRACVRYLSLNRSNDNNEIFFSTNVEFKVRYYVPVTEWDRILWNKKLYRILSVIPNKDNLDITIETEVINE